MEEIVLKNLVRKHKDAIESKKTDAETNKIKNDAWEKVTQEFNAVSGEVYRDVKSLRNKYDNMKKRTHLLMEGKRLFNGIPGGPPTEITISDEDSISEMTGIQLTGLTSYYDSDASK